MTREERAVNTHLNVATIPKGLRTTMNIKPLTSTRAWKSEPRQNSFAFFACEQCCKKYKGPRRACFHSCYSRANSSQKIFLILPTHEYEMPEKNTGKRLPDSTTHFCGHKTQLRQTVKLTANYFFILFVCLHPGALFSDMPCCASFHHIVTQKTTSCVGLYAAY